MGIGVSIFLVAIGAILAFAVHVTPQGLDLQTVGVILMIVGVVGGALSAMFWQSWGGFPRRNVSTTTVGHTVVDPGVRPMVDAAGRPVVAPGVAAVPTGTPVGTVPPARVSTTETEVVPPGDPYVG